MCRIGGALEDWDISVLGYLGVMVLMGCRVIGVSVIEVLFMELGLMRGLGITADTDRRLL